MHGVSASFWPVLSCYLYWGSLGIDIRLVLSKLTYDPGFICYTPQARDMIVLLRNCLPPRADQIEPAEVPEYLEYRQEGVDDEQRGYARRVIGVGHSIGGNAL